MGYEGVLTTFSSYGNVASARQAEIIRDLNDPTQPTAEIDELKRQLMKVLQGRGT